MDIPTKGLGREDGVMGEGGGVRDGPVSCPMAGFHFSDAETLFCTRRYLVLRYFVGI